MNRWQFNFAVDGWMRANSSDSASAEALSEDEHDRLMKKYA
jgi:hypothetical protein